VQLKGIENKPAAYVIAGMNVIDIFIG